MPKKEGLSLNEHIEAAKLMKQVNNDLSRLQLIFAKAYGKSREPCLSVTKTIKTFAHATSNADELFNLENPGEAVGPYSVVTLICGK